MAKGGRYAIKENRQLLEMQDTRMHMHMCPVFDRRKSHSTGKTDMQAEGNQLTFPLRSHSVWLQRSRSNTNWCLLEGESVF